MATQDWELGSRNIPKPSRNESEGQGPKIHWASSALLKLGRFSSSSPCVMIWEIVSQWYSRIATWQCWLHNLIRLVCSFFWVISSLHPVFSVPRDFDSRPIPPCIDGFYSFLLVAFEAKLPSARVMSLEHEKKIVYVLKSASFLWHRHRVLSCWFDRLSVYSII